MADSDHPSHPTEGEQSDAPATPRTARAPDAGERDDNRPPAPRSCGECGRDIPPDQAVTAEGQEYVIYFCSPGCHAAWHEAHTSTDAPPPDPDHTPRHQP